MLIYLFLRRLRDTFNKTTAVLVIVSDMINTVLLWRCVTVSLCSTGQYSLEGFLWSMLSVFRV